MSSLERSTTFRTRLSVPTLVLLGFLSGCAMGPNYKKVEPETPAAWLGAHEDNGREGPGASAPTTVPPESHHRWWLAFDDPTLTKLVERARAKSLTLEIARARLAEARAATGIARAGLLPSFSASSGASDQRVSNRAFEVFPLPQGAEPERDREIYRAGLDASWEFDLFGRNRRSLEAARARLGGAEAALDAARLSVTSETARAYLEYRGAEAGRQALENAIAFKEEALELVNRKRETGLATRVDVARARSALESARAELPGLCAEIRLRAYQLGVLAAMPPRAILDFLEESATDGSEATVAENTLSAANRSLNRDAAPEPHQLVPQPAWTQPAELPLRVIRSRPDVNQAERKLAASAAEVAMATANLYPRINLSAALFAESSAIGELDASQNQGYNLMGGILAPIWQGGRLRARLDAVEASRNAAEGKFQQTVLRALADVESALVGYVEAQNRLRRQLAAREANAEFARLTRHLYDADLAELLTLTEAQAQLAQSERALARATTQAASQAVTLNKALGGGRNGL